MSKSWYFTLSANQGGPGCVEVVAENYDDATNKMIEQYGTKWALQYASIDEVHPYDREILGVIA
jgi:hypothetical protein